MSNPNFPAAIWRQCRQIAAGKYFCGSYSWGYTNFAVARWFTPGYMLSPLRGSSFEC